MREQCSQRFMVGFILLFCISQLNAAFSPVFTNKGSIDKVMYGKKKYYKGAVVLPVLPQKSVSKKKVRLTYARLPVLMDEDDHLYEQKVANNAPTLLSKKTMLMDQVEKVNVEEAKKDFAAHLFKAREWRREDVKAGRLFRPDCFYEIMGCYEIEFREWGKKTVPAWEKYPPLELLKKSPDGFIPPPQTNAQNQPLGRNALCGSSFTLLSVDGLEQEVEKVQSNVKPSWQGSFTLLDGYVLKEKLGWSKALELTDLTYLQEHNPGALFQLFATTNTVGGDGRLEELQYAPTQAKNALLSTMGAALIRKYVLPPITLVKAKQNFVGLHTDVVVTSGYYGCYSQKLPDPFSKQEAVAAERLSFLEDRLVVKKGDDPLFIFNRLIDLREPAKLVRVDQVFVGSLSFSKGLAVDRAKSVLEAAYKGALYAAALSAVKKNSQGVLKTPQKLFLTLGCVEEDKNNIEWVVEILKKPWVMELIKAFGLEVYLVVYPSTDPEKAISPEDLALLRQLEPPLPKLAQALNTLAYRF